MGLSAGEAAQDARLAQEPETAGEADDGKERGGIEQSLEVLLRALRGRSFLFVLLVDFENNTFMQSKLTLKM